MTGLQSSVGLISGIDYTSLVEQLIAIDGVSKTRLEARNEILKAEEKAITDVMPLYLTASFMIGNLNKLSVFKGANVTSSNPSVLAASKSGPPIVGSYTFVPS